MTRPLMTCRELIEFLDRYVEEALASAQRSEFDRHLARCPACVAYLENYRDVIRASGIAFASPHAAAPDEVPDDLIAAVLAARRERSEEG